MASKQLTDSDLDVVRGSLTLLTEIKDAAFEPEDLSGDVAKEVV
jgi:hypothetical protein